MDGILPKESSYKRKRMQRMGPDLGAKDAKWVQLRTWEEAGGVPNPNSDVIPLCSVLPMSKNKGKAREVAVPNPRQTEGYEPSVDTGWKTG
ncbi:hypothetical protein CBOM_04820 [Ceraceosorus bombacis]|uniref:Uncharacterized protein n=1 Tax=Ceraceosorus bombacis TaxID=401625 RepID=A0A0N7LB52_9BASI|nr:hypothetical protein CBOM_04820 [Ceraceosorus bombacis]